MADRKLDDPVIRSKFLVEVAKGKPHSTAAKKAGISTSTVRRAMRSDPEFREQVLDAEEDAFAPVEKTVREMAVAGDIGAVKEYRSMKRRREAEEARRMRHEHLHDHRVIVDARADIGRLITTLQERKNALDEAPEAVELERST